MKTFLHYLTVATLLAFYSTTNAAEGFYFGGGIGLTSFDTGDVTAVSFDDDSDTGFRVFAGYDFTDNFGVEVDYVRLGELDFTDTYFDTVTIDFSAISLVGVLRYPFTDTADAFIKLGMTRVEGEIDVGGGLSASADDSGTTYGLGARYLLDQFLISAEWQSYDQDADMFSLGIGYHF